MTRGFREKFGDLADFYFIEGPFDVQDFEGSPEPGLLAKGFQPPFKEWVTFINLNMSEKEMVEAFKHIRQREIKHPEFAEIMEEE